MRASGRGWRGLAVVLAAGMLLAGCAYQGTGPAPRGGDPAEPPLVFQLGSVEIVDDTGAEQPGMADAFATPPDQALRNWAALRLQETGGRPGLLRFHMTTAQAERRSLDGTPGIKGWFTRDQTERVAITLAGRLEALRNDGSLIASASARAASHRTFDEKTTPAERRAGLDELLAATVAAFDREMQARVREDMDSVLE